MEASQSSGEALTLSVSSFSCSLSEANLIVMFDESQILNLRGLYLLMAPLSLLRVL